VSRLSVSSFGVLIAVTIVTVQPASASDLSHEFVNPSFGGSSFNSSHLLGVANAVNPYKDPASLNSNDPSQQFLRTLQSRLLSAVASQITDLIFGDNPQESGLIKFGDQEISFVRGADGVTLTITNALDGSVTEIVVPLLNSTGL
jgi:curli production assembly/transport component CsgF